MSHGLMSGSCAGEVRGGCSDSGQLPSPPLSPPLRSGNSPHLFPSGCQPQRHSHFTLLSPRPPSPAVVAVTCEEAVTSAHRLTSVDDVIDRECRDDSMLTRIVRLPPGSLLRPPHRSPLPPSSAAASRRSFSSLSTLSSLRMAESGRGGSKRRRDGALNKPPTSATPSTDSHSRQLTLLQSGLVLKTPTRPTTMHPRDTEQAEAEDDDIEEVEDEEKRSVSPVPTARPSSSTATPSPSTAPRPSASSRSRNTRAVSLAIPHHNEERERFEMTFGSDVAFIEYKTHRAGSATSLRLTARQLLALQHPRPSPLLSHHSSDSSLLSLSPSVQCSHGVGGLRDLRSHPPSWPGPRSPPVRRSVRGGC